MDGWVLHCQIANGAQSLLFFNAGHHVPQRACHCCCRAPSVARRVHSQQRILHRADRKPQKRGRVEKAASAASAGHVPSRRSSSVRRSSRSGCCCLGLGLRRGIFRAAAVPFSGGLYGLWRCSPAKGAKYRLYRCPRKPATASVVTPSPPRHSLIAPPQPSLSLHYFPIPHRRFLPLLSLLSSLDR
jgi:hypothetical protein